MAFTYPKVGQSNTETVIWHTPKGPKFQENIQKTDTNEYSLKENTKTKWNMLRESLVMSANDIIPKNTRQDRNEWTRGYSRDDEKATKNRAKN